MPRDQFMRSWKRFHLVISKGIAYAGLLNVRPEQNEVGDDTEIIVFLDNHCHKGYLMP